MTRRSVVLNLHWPPRELSPNARVHWGTRKRATAKYRSDCYLDIRTAAGPRIGWPVSPVTAEVTFVVPDRRRRDLDNALASMKAAWDAMVSVGLLVDDDAAHLRLGQAQVRYEKGQKYVEVKLR